MKRLYLLLVFPFYVIAANSQVEFSLEKFSDTKKMCKKIVEITPDFFVKHNVEHLQIIECKAEISVSENAGSLAFPTDNKFVDFYRKKHPEYSKKIGEDYFESTLDVLYNRFNKMLSDNGLFPTEKTNVISNETYLENELGKVNYSEYDGSEISNFSEDSKFIVSSSGMKPLPKDMDYNATEEFNQELAKIASDNKVDAALKIHIDISIDENGKILLNKYEVSMDTWLTSFKKGSETIYKWKLIDTELFNLKTEIQGSKSHEDLNSLDTELINILDTVTEMYSYVLSSYL